MTARRQPRRTPAVHIPPTDATTRFSDRVADYVRFRPGYPAGVIELLRERCNLDRNSVVADLGAGTGIFARLLLEAGTNVHALEPNAEMRAAMAAASRDHARLHIHDTPAEATGLASDSVDLITAAQAFHWFERRTARTEFQRILRPAGRVALIWNTRRDDTPFLEAYDQLLQAWATDYGRVEHRNIDQATIASFFTPGAVDRHDFDNAQYLDLPGLVGRFNSSSYAPPPGHPNHEPAIRALGEIFHEHARNAVVAFEYTTEVYLGRFD